MPLKEQYDCLTKTRNDGLKLISCYIWVEDGVESIHSIDRMETNGNLSSLKSWTLPSHTRLK